MAAAGVDIGASEAPPVEVLDQAAADSAVAEVAVVGKEPEAEPPAATNPNAT